MRAVDTAGNESTNTTQYSCTTLDALPPADPTNITAIDAHIGGRIDLAWTKPADSDLSHVHIYRSTTSGVLGPLVYDNVTTTTKSDTSLTNGVTYYYTIRSVDTSANESANITQVSATPTAVDVTAPAGVTNVSITDPQTGGVLNLSWTNPATSDLAWVKIYRSTISGQLGTLAYEVSGISQSDKGLTTNSTYYYTFHTVDTSYNESADATQYPATPSNIWPPKPVTGLTASILAGSQVRLDWVRSASAEVSTYHIYSDHGTGMIDYATPAASIAHPATTWTSASLTPDTRYQFAVRAEDTSGNKETNTAVVISVTAVSNPTGKVSTIIKTPVPGARVSGNNLTIKAENTMGTPAGTGQVEFQYKPIVGGSWISIATVTSQPYAATWDASALADGDYQLRSQATSTPSNVVDAEPPTIRVSKVSADPTVSESVVGGIQTSVQQVTAAAPNTLYTQTLLGPAKITIPAGALDSDAQATVTVPDPATVSGSVPATYGKVNLFIDVSFDTGQHQLANSSTATIEIPYRDDNNDNIVDGTGINIYDVQICDYDGTTWTPLPTTVDTANKKFIATTTKFSLLGALVPPRPAGTGANLLAVPLTPTNNSASAVFGPVSAYSNYVQYWDPTAQKYNTVTTIAPGKSYWVYGNNKSLSVAGTETPNTNFSIPIKKGWNMVGSPFRFKVNVADAQVLYGGNYYTLANAETNGWVVGTFYSYQGGAYQGNTLQDSGVLEAWKGYWFLSDIDGDLIIPPTPSY